MGDGMLFDCLAVLSLFIVLLLLRRFIGVFPSLVGCLVRGKESINLEASVKLSRDRDAVAVAMILPFCLVACRYRLYDPGFMSGLSENLRLGITAGTFAAYCIFRTVISRLFRPRKMNRNTIAAAGKASMTFFIILTLLLLAVGGTLAFIGVSPEVIKNAMLWISAAIYAVFLLRKTQIFASSCSVFAGFLYLCALEIIPTGTLVVSALIF